MTPVSSPSPESVLAKPLAEPLILPRAARATVLAYHELFPHATDYSYSLSSGQFESHLQLGVHLCNHSRGAGLPLIYSFDDGHISNYTHALPLLEKYSCKAIFFVIAGRVSQHKDFMTWTHLRELTSLGHRVESHSWSHKFLTDCPAVDLREELERSRETLEDRLATSVKALSAPHGRWDRRVLNNCAEAGYEQLYTSDPWSSSLKFKPVELIGRLVMVQSMNSTGLLNWLTMGRTEAGLRRAQSVLKRSARQMMGNKLYYRLWARFSGWKGPDDTTWNGNRG